MGNIPTFSVQFLPTATGLQRPCDHQKAHGKKDLALCFTFEIGHNRQRPLLGRVHRQFEHILAAFATIEQLKRKIDEASSKQPSSTYTNQALSNPMKKESYTSRTVHLKSDTIASTRFSGECIGNRYSAICVQARKVGKNQRAYFRPNVHDRCHAFRCMRAVPLINGVLVDFLFNILVVGWG